MKREFEVEVTVRLRYSIAEPTPQQLEAFLSTRESDAWIDSDCGIAFQAAVVRAVLGDPDLVSWILLEQAQGDLIDRLQRPGSLGEPENGRAIDARLLSSLPEAYKAPMQDLIRDHVASENLPVLFFGGPNDGAPFTIERRPDVAVRISEKSQP